MNIVKPIGEVIRPNKDGYFVSTVDQDQTLQKDWQQPVRLCVQVIQKHLPNLIYSIYLRGSVARGDAIAGVSDIDLVVIAKNKLPDSYSRAWKRPFIKNIRHKFPQVDDVEFEIVSLPELKDTSKPMGIRVLLALQSKLLVGSDVLVHLPPIKPDDSSFVHIPTFSIFQEKVKRNLANKEVYLPAYVPWVAKRYIRTGFELCIEREQVFTRDLYPCYKIFSKYYPGKENEMYKVLEQAIRPTWTQSELIRCVKSLGGWLSQEVKKSYLQY